MWDVSDDFGWDEMSYLKDRTRVVDGQLELSAVPCPFCDRPFAAGGAMTMGKYGYGIYQATLKAPVCKGFGIRFEVIAAARPGQIDVEPTSLLTVTITHA
jgi:hypothetical protein